MAWDFSGDKPRIIVYETKAPVSEPFLAFLVSQGEIKDGKQLPDRKWHVEFPAKTYEAAHDRASNWWDGEREKHDAAIAKAEQREANRARGKS